MSDREYQFIINRVLNQKGRSSTYSTVSDAWERYKMKQHKHDKGKRKLNSLVNKRLTKLVQLELRFSQRSCDHTPDINNTDINPNPFEYLLSTPAGKVMVVFLLIAFVQASYKQSGFSPLQAFIKEKEVALYALQKQSK